MLKFLLLPNSIYLLFSYSITRLCLFGHWHWSFKRRKFFAWRAAYRRSIPQSPVNLCCTWLDRPIARPILIHPLFHFPVFSLLLHAHAGILAPRAKRAGCTRWPISSNIWVGLSKILSIPSSVQSGLGQHEISRIG